MNGLVTNVSYTPDELSIDMDEALRYLGYKKAGITSADYQLVSDAVEEVRRVMAPKACYARYDFHMDGSGNISMPYGEIVSKNLTTNLTGCSEIFIFAATIGARFDMKLKRKQARSMAAGAVFNACGAAAVEAVCNRLNDELAAAVVLEGGRLHPRYSPGYGDLTLDNQSGIFRLLEPARHIGLTLKDTLIMAPEKSVTAIIGIEK